MKDIDFSTRENNVAKPVGNILTRWPSLNILVCSFVLSKAHLAKLETAKTAAVRVGKELIKQAGYCFLGFESPDARLFLKRLIELKD